MRQLLLLLVVASISCGPAAEDKLRVGAKDFAENRILAEAARQALAADGYTVAPVTVCGDTFGCQRALREGSLDIVPEYSGTGLFFLGESVPQGAPAVTLDKVRTAYEPLGLSWRGALGFDNGYRVYVTRAAAQARGWSTVADLASAGALRVVCPPTYVRRPRDGMGALAERHGVRLAGPPLLLDTVSERIDALVDGRADFAVVYATDGAVRGRGLVALRDSLNFFPPYEASYIVRSDTLRAHQGLGASLARLEGRFDEEQMRDLNYKVDVEGRSPAEVAATFLAGLELLPDGQRKSKASVVAVARHEKDDQGLLELGAVRAVRAAYPSRAVDITPVKDPIVAVVRGGPRLALLGAERFFVRKGEGLPSREERLEAVAVVGARWVHALRVDGGTDMSGRVGVGPVGSGSALVGELLAGDATLYGDPATLAAALRDKRIDVAILVGPRGDPRVKAAIVAGARLVPVRDRVSGAKAPFLREARLPPATYTGQTSALDTYTSQVVLAAPARQPTGLSAGGGPAAALPGSGLPMSILEAQALADGTGVLETPDPALPSAFNPMARPAEDDGANAVGRTLLNLGAILFLVWVAILMLRRPRRDQSSSKNSGGTSSVSQTPLSDTKNS
jgi:glycine betaine/choline ABC-type transport system substrate-binding protein